MDGIGAVPVADFLPPAAEIQPSRGDFDLRLSLSADSLAVFQREAERRNMRVEDVVRQVLEGYARRQR